MNNRDQSNLRFTGKESEFFKNSMEMERKNIQQQVSKCILQWKKKGNFHPPGWQITAEIIETISSDEMESLHKTCIQLLFDYVNISNALILLEFAIENSIKILYSKCLKICTEAAFIILDSVTFYQIKPFTIITLASHPELNISEESEIFYALWIRATVDCSRNDENATYENILKYFQPYHCCIEFSDVDPYKLQVYKNKDILRYYTSEARNIDVLPTKRLFAQKRRVKFPLELPPNIYIHYNPNHIQSLSTLGEKQHCIEFSVNEFVYLIQFEISCILHYSSVKRAVKHINFRNSSHNLVSFGESNASMLSVHLFQKSIYMKPMEQEFQVFEYTLKDTIKLYPNETYYLTITSSSSNLLWPVYSSWSSGLKKCPIDVHGDIVKCLTSMKLLPLPQYQE